MPKILRVDEMSLEQKAELVTKLYGEWTTKPPTQEGWYWAADRGGEIGIYRVFRSVHDDSLKVWTNEDYDGGLSDFAYWLGPLPMPDAPKG